MIYHIKIIPDWFMSRIIERFGNPSYYEIKPYWYDSEKGRVFAAEIIINGFLYDNSLQLLEVKP
jgi:hypothetical protein